MQFVALSNHMKQSSLRHIFSLGGALFLCLQFVFMLAPAHAATSVDWSGAWDSRWSGGGARLELEQDGVELTGRYRLHGGEIEGQLDGRKLTGTWREPDRGREGTFEFVMARDGLTFMGRYGTGEWWTGQRVGTFNDRKINTVQLSPMTTMRSFLVAMNESGADDLERNTHGNLDLQGDAADLVDLSQSNRGDMNRIDYTSRLFQVLDQMTLRVWTLPDDSEAQEKTVTLKQSGTDISFDITFVQKDDLWFILGPSLAELDSKNAELVSARPDVANDPKELRSARDAFKLFLWGIATYGYASDNPAYAALDTSEFSSASLTHDTSLHATYLKQVLDRTGHILWQEIPDDPLAQDSYIHFEHPAGNIVVAPVETDDGTVWKFTPDTLTNIRALYAAIDQMPVIEERDIAGRQPVYFRIRNLVRSPAPSMLIPLGPIERWQWGALIVFVSSAMFASFLIGTLVEYLLYFKRRRDNKPRVRADIFTWSARAVSFGIMLLTGIYLLGLPENFSIPIKTLANIAIVLPTVAVAWVLIGQLAISYRKQWDAPGYHDTLISLVAGALKVVLVIAAFAILAELLAIPYQGVIAGLGIGGLAVALAAQPTLQNFVSGLTLYADRPVSVGDFCRFGDTLGTVEHIGMRSTRIRSLDRTIVTVPNSEFANLELENYTSRDQNRFATTLRLHYETTAEQLQNIVAGIRLLLLDDKRVDDDPCRVRLTNFGDYSFDIEIFAYVNTADYGEFLEIREELLLETLGIIEETGAKLAISSRISYQSEDVFTTTGPSEKTEIT